MRWLLCALVFFFCLFCFFFSKRPLGTLVLTHLPVVVTHFFLPQAWQSALSFLTFCFCVYHSPYYILIILAFFLLYNTFYYYNVLAAILSLFTLCYLVYAYASISSLGVKTAGFWIWKRASKFRASTFFFFLLPLIFSLCLSIGGVFGFSVFRFLSLGPIPP